MSERGEMDRRPLRIESWPREFNLNATILIVNVSPSSQSLRAEESLAGLVREAGFTAHFLNTFDDPISVQERLAPFDVQCVISIDSVESNEVATEISSIFKVKFFIYRPIVDGDSAQLFDGKSSEQVYSHGLCIDAARALPFLGRQSSEKLEGKAYNPTVMYHLGSVTEFKKIVRVLGSLSDQGFPSSLWIARNTHTAGRQSISLRMEIARHGEAIVDTADSDELREALSNVDLCISSVGGPDSAWFCLEASAAGKAIVNPDRDSFVDEIRRVFRDAEFRADQGRNARLSVVDTGSTHARGTEFESVLASKGVPRQSTSMRLPSDFRTQSKKRVLVASHDLKFADFILDAIKKYAEVTIDEWHGHAIHDEDVSKDLLNSADIIFCEWGLGNLEWYALNKRHGQRLVVRIHSQEIRLPYLSRVVHENVDAYIFVGEFIRESAVEFHGVPREKTVVIPNPIDAKAMQQPKVSGAEWTIGMAGYVPRLKRLDRALDLIEELNRRDGRFHLKLRGHSPNSYEWMAKKSSQSRYFEDQISRIDVLNRGVPGLVSVDEFGTDMADWYQNVGTVISVSDFESFHLVLAEGAASSALPVSLAWPGADLIYPRRWIVGSVPEMADLIAETAPAKVAPEYAEFVAQNFDRPVVIPRVLKTIFG